MSVQHKNYLTSRSLLPAVSAALIVNKNLSYNITINQPRVYCCLCIGGLVSRQICVKVLNGKV